ncbi:peptidoglycan-binding domain-containing protein [Deinococcus arcticus]|uniref:Peptidoglycan-binding protein n=1 Tax=Deinococcus arcticus TaxID=2136176 RepID=A0A2T3W788_9DEIO|nr:peptidoglycan-binding domain-containing protein [Deinococcus arcticus]PTA67613.1 peptidoglycan-binding protein [Deinococcus arcticus]
MTVSARSLWPLAPALLGLALAAPPSAPATTLERAATRLTQSLGGVLRNCPASFQAIGTANKQCVGVTRTVEQTRLALTGALGDDLYGVWRSKDDQRSVYNWLRTPGGTVYLRLQPDPEGRAQTLLYLDVPPGSAPASGTVPSTGAAGTAGAAGTVSSGATTSGASSAGASVRPASTPVARSAAPLAFRRTLQVQSPRLNGPDVLAVQNRLIALMRPARSGQGDGWYGPVTANTVRAFQASAGLRATGRVDRATWDALFSTAAKPFTPPPSP